jgi:hypothetical protein
VDAAPDDDRDRFLAAIKSAKVFFYNAAVAQAHRIDVGPSGITFAFLPNKRVPRDQCEENRAWLQKLAEQTLGRPLPVRVTTVEPDGAGAVPPAPAAASTPSAAPAGPAPADAPASPEALRQKAMADPMVQSMLEIFPVETVKVEEM